MPSRYHITTLLANALIMFGLALAPINPVLADPPSSATALTIYNCVKEIAGYAPTYLTYNSNDTRLAIAYEKSGAVPYRQSVTLHCVTSNGCILGVSWGGGISVPNGPFTGILGEGVHNFIVITNAAGVPQPPC